ncbi:hypothetical protein [Trabulsiella odontotermitis]|uniref:hypothetical protein n=1 Tax=Trabulsiella odontotermitis TaxID=379893 RepID=UPI00092CF496|nr:hypothetical protein [Trabulsiella odontotermitis]
MNKSTNNCLRNVSAARFNQLHTIGARFNYYPVLGIPDSVPVVTESEAWDLCGRPVVKISGRIGGVSICHLEPAGRDVIQAAQLAAENAELKYAIVTLQDRYMGWEGLSDTFEAALSIKTPATDAVLAEVRAQGVEMFVQKCNSKADQALAADIRDNWKLLGEHASDFAAQLRLEATELPTCPHCGAQIHSALDRFCSQCGGQLTDKGAGK